MTVGTPQEAYATREPLPRDSPYQGLVPYDEADADWYFGRRDARDMVVDSLKAYRVTVVYGESGVGKTSLLRAAVLPHLGMEARCNLELDGTPGVVAATFANWSVRDPLKELKRTICDTAARFSGPLHSGASEGALAEVVSMCAERVGGVVFVILDQIEEIFLYHEADSAGRAFEEELAGAIRQRTDAANFVLSVREDAVAKLDRLQRRIPSLLDNLVRIEHLDERDARDAIERPLDRWRALSDVAVSIEPALVDDVLSEVRAGRMLLGAGGGIGHVESAGGERRIEAPYLQLVLTRIWSEERAQGSSVLRVETFKRLGGADVIVRTHLDRVLGSFSRQDRKVAATALRYLVTPSGTKIAHRTSDLADYTRVPAATLERVLSALSGEPRILRPTVGGAYEIYHDVLAAAVLDWRRRYQERRSNSLLARAAGLAIAAFVIAAMIAVYEGHVLTGLTNDTINARFSIRGSERPPTNVAVVGIDDATFEHVNMQWPFPRRVEGKVVDRLANAGARAIAFDVQLSAPSALGQNDDIALLNAINAHPGKTVFADTESTTNGQLLFLGSDQGNQLLSQVGSRPAQSLFPFDGGGVIRRMAYTVSHLKTLAVAAVEVATASPIKAARFPGSSTTIDYVGAAATVPTVPYWRVLTGRFNANAFRGKIVVVGATTPSLEDIHPTPVGDMSGPEIQANAVETILEGFPLRTRAGLDLLLIVALALVVPLASLRFGSIALVATAFVTAGLYLVAAQVAFDHGVLVSVVIPLLGLILTTVGVLAWRALRTRPL